MTTSRAAHFGYCYPNTPIIDNTLLFADQRSLLTGFGFGCLVSGDTESEHMREQAVGTTDTLLSQQARNRDHCIYLSIRSLLSIVDHNTN